MVCNNCGAENRDTAKFCSNCGSPLAGPMVAEGTADALPTTPQLDNTHLTQALDSANLPPTAPKSNKGKIIGCALAAALVVIFIGWLATSKTGAGSEAASEGPIETNSEWSQEWGQASIFVPVDRYVIDDEHANVDGAALSQAAYPGDELGYWHAMLDEQRQAIYEEAYAQISAGQTEFHLSNLRQGDSITDEEITTFLNALRAVYYDHPELFWWSGKAKAIREQGNGFDFELDLLYDPSEWDAIQAQMDAAVEEFAATVTDDMADWEKALAAYEWIGRHVDYDYDASYGEGEENEANLRLEQGAATALVDGLSVCAGYAKAYALLLRRVGVPCAVVGGEVNSSLYSEHTIRAWIREYLEESWESYTEDDVDGIFELYMEELAGDEDGTVSENGDHAWNIIWICGEVGYSDSTWGDHWGTADWTQEVDERGYLRPTELGYLYNMFFMTDEEQAEFGYVIDSDSNNGTDAWEVDLLPDCSVDVGNVQTVEVECVRAEDAENAG